MLFELFLSGALKGPKNKVEFAPPKNKLRKPGSLGTNSSFMSDFMNISQGLGGLKGSMNSAGDI